MKKTILGMIFLLFLFSGLMAGEDRRTTPITVYLIFDGSEAIKNGKNSAAAWLNEHIIDTMLQEGDNLTLWIAAEKPEVVFSGVLNGTAQKETVKELLRSVTPGGPAADYAGALREALAREKSKTGEGISYTLLVTGTAGGPSRGNTAGELLRYAKVQDFSGWRLQVVGLDLGQRVQKAVSDYMSGS
ncbi:MAG: hypothetical protein LBP43_04915 [Treponema sp.]|jgi:hypothetical protein|nr:hypothetical protein [Treponema sp.]